MRIAITQNIADISGVPNYVGQLAAGLKKRGHEVWVVTPDGPNVERYRADGIEVKIFAPTKDIDWGYIASLRDWLKQNRIEILHTNMLKTTVNGLVAGKLAGTPVRVAHIHGTLVDWEVHWFKKWPNIVVNSTVCNLLATDVVALTPSIKRQLVRQEGVWPSKISVIPNGIALPDASKFNRDYLRQKFELPPNIKTVGTFSRLTVEKGLPTLFEALPDVLSADKNVHVFIAGEGDQRPRLENIAAAIDAERIHFLGFVSEEEKWDYFCSLDTYAFPSTREGFGLTLVEAMAAGCLVVCSDLPVLADIVEDGQTGLLYNSSDAQALADALKRAISMSEPERQAVTQAARHRVASEYSSGQFITRYEQLYRQRLSHESL